MNSILDKWCLTPFISAPFYFEDFTSNAITTKMRIGGGDSVNAVMSRPLGDFKSVENQVGNNSAWRAAA